MFQQASAENRQKLRSWLIGKRGDHGTLSSATESFPLLPSKFIGSELLHKIPIRIPFLKREDPVSAVLQSPMLDELDKAIASSEMSYDNKVYELSQASLTVHNHILDRALQLGRKAVDDEKEWRRVQHTRFEIYLERSPLYWAQLCRHSILLRCENVREGFGLQLGQYLKRDSDTPLLSAREQLRHVASLYPSSSSPGRKLSLFSLTLTEQSTRWKELDQLEGDPFLRAAEELLDTVRAESHSSDSHTNEMRSLEQAVRLAEKKLNVMRDGIPSTPSILAARCQFKMSKLENHLLTLLGYGNETISSEDLQDRDAQSVLRATYLRAITFREFLRLSSPQVMNMEKNDFEWRNKHMMTFDESTDEGRMKKIAQLLRSNLDRLSDFEEEVMSVLSEYGRPSNLSRNWLRYTITVTTVLASLKYLYARQENISNWFNEIYLSVNHFFHRYLEEPLLHIWKTIRYEGKDYAVINPKALDEDVNSLGRMVVDFAKKSGQSLTAEQISAIRESAKTGDIGTILTTYEKDIQGPIRGALFGDLIQLILIQVQKTRVDAERGLAAVDQLLKANELNFEALGVIPAVAFSYLTVRFAYRTVLGTLDYKQIRNYIRDEMRSVDRLLNLSLPEHGKANMTLREQGRLLISIDKLKYYAQKSLSSRQRVNFLEDLHDLGSSQQGAKRKQNTVNRMYRNYNFLAPI
ncbi:hypothetical protein PROFUN_05416 [Planoprotostelium fungivorum]|uniref:Nuclear control of ATPase protein 2 n=1 Tax=Planoprotostelium fungivorum TaxID=1890364 RepID=A0A2P6NQP3_9EUKA|nr:hypothetical protein PROFUN_05416 [Planoprotostelium fungivorum]